MHGGVKGELATSGMHDLLGYTAFGVEIVRVGRICDQNEPYEDCIFSGVILTCTL